MDIDISVTQFWWVGLCPSHQEISSVASYSTGWKRVPRFGGLNPPNLRVAPGNIDCEQICKVSQICPLGFGHRRTVEGHGAIGLHPPTNRQTGCMLTCLCVLRVALFR